MSDTSDSNNTKTIMGVAVADLLRSAPGARPADAVPTKQRVTPSSPARAPREVVASIDDKAPVVEDIYLEATKSVEMIGDQRARETARRDSHPAYTPPPLPSLRLEAPAAPAYIAVPGSQPHPRGRGTDPKAMLPTAVKAMLPTVTQSAVWPTDSARTQPAPPVAVTNDRHRRASTPAMPLRTGEAKYEVSGTIDCDPDAKQFETDFDDGSEATSATARRGWLVGGLVLGALVLSIGVGLYVRSTITSEPRVAKTATKRTSASTTKTPASQAAERTDVDSAAAAAAKPTQRDSAAVATAKPTQLDSAAATAEPTRDSAAVPTAKPTQLDSAAGAAAKPTPKPAQSVVLDASSSRTTPNPNAEPITSHSSTRVALGDGSCAVTVESSASARVSVDDQAVGLTPVEASGLWCGRPIVVRLQRSGFETWTKTIIPQEGRRSRIMASLRRLPPTPTPPAAKPTPPAAKSPPAATAEGSAH